MASGLQIFSFPMFFNGTKRYCAISFQPRWTFTNSRPISHQLYSPLSYNIGCEIHSSSRLDNTTHAAAKEKKKPKSLSATRLFSSSTFHSKTRATVGKVFESQRNLFGSVAMKKSFNFGLAEIVFLNFLHLSSLAAPIEKKRRLEN